MFLHGQYRKWWIKFIVGPFLLATPPAVVSAYYGNTEFRTQLTSWYSGASVLSDNVVIVVLGMALYPTVVLAGARFVLHYADANALTAFWLTRLNAALDRVVGCKASRFEDNALENGEQVIAPQTAFCTITQPQKQIGELARGICEFFNAIAPGNEDHLIRVVLVAVEDGKITNIPFHFPEDERVRATREVLNDPKSTIQTSLREKEIVVIQSIAAEMKKPKQERRYVSSGNSSDDVGSLICFPVPYGNAGEIPFVISVHCDNDGYFREAKRGIYQHTLERFGLRMQLEYSLLLMKERVCAE